MGHLISFCGLESTEPLIIVALCLTVFYCVDRLQAEGRRTDCLVWWFCFFLLGLLEALLGKPGTLHSLGQTITSALGVPPDLRGASVPGRSLEVHGRVEGVGCILTDPVGRVCLSYQAGKIPLPKSGWGIIF